ncbi:hypothetical protein OG2516_06429 [Oceanicola granulosus HTCC2516]|uniref:T6SS Phospholipase effector Tle1-like catalytic domain-containing protein n=1 Tax=Oceanicola granulosus (strain ATCC BAA-861 / DSM 15982 / KCTC 12143 / HTCC2516) TaxID=314256 RepID=Q2CBP6_OCEGH|nr:DUF2235 domain-containing protein [Oceanicola granulosus]EAR50085.1 hypothetical protein OG2516_06429 [Oceanicola granulosus HTCC2516]
MPLRDFVFGLFGRKPVQAEGRGRHRGQATHVIVLDGTMSTLREGYETNAGLTFKLLREVGRSANLTVYYEAGIQWRDWSHTVDVAAGRGIGRQIRRAYGTLASRYRPGDRIVLIGFSRGAYAVRSLAGIVDMVGLLQDRHANVRNVRQAYRHYKNGGRGTVAENFRRRFCHEKVEIEAVAVWDTVKSLGIRLGWLGEWMGESGRFHNHALGPIVKNGFHALALDETRDAYRPVLWNRMPGWEGRLEQVWFRGTHGDIGGQYTDGRSERGLANISLVWLLGRLESVIGLPLPAGWRGRFPEDADAPPAGTWSGWGKILLSRHRRVVGRDASERIHPTAVPHLGGQLPAPVWQREGAAPERPSPQATSRNEARGAMPSA